MNDGELFDRSRLRLRPLAQRAHDLDLTALQPLEFSQTQPIGQVCVDLRHAGGSLQPVLQQCKQSRRPLDRRHPAAVVREPEGVAAQAGGGIEHGRPTAAEADGLKEQPEAIDPARVPERTPDEIDVQRTRPAALRKAQLQAIGRDRQQQVIRGVTGVDERQTELCGELCRLALEGSLGLGCTF